MVKDIGTTFSLNFQYDYLGRAWMELDQVSFYKCQLRLHFLQNGDFSLGRDRAVKTAHKTLAQIVCKVQKNTAKRPRLRPALLVKMFIRYGQKCGFASTYLDKHKWNYVVETQDASFHVINQRYNNFWNFLCNYLR